MLFFLRSLFGNKMNNGFSNLNELIINIVVKIRLADTPGEGEINACVS